MQIIADVGGRPGIDCRGYCKYCYFKGVKDFPPLGCRNCPPNRIGCETCTIEVAERKSGFLPPFFVLSNVQTTLMMTQPQERRNLKINISGGGDISCYPRLEELTNGLKSLGIPNQPYRPIGCHSMPRAFNGWLKKHYIFLLFIVYWCYPWTVFYAFSKKTFCGASYYLLFLHYTLMISSF